MSHGLSVRLAIVAVFGVVGVSLIVPIGAGVRAVEQSSPVPASMDRMRARFRISGGATSDRHVAAGPRRRRGAQPAVHLLHGSDRRRRLEDGELRRRLDADQRRPDRHRIDRLDRRLRVQTRTSSGSAPAAPRSAATSSSAAASTGRPTPAARGSSWASRTPARSAASSFTRPTPTSSGWRRSGSPFGPNDERGIFKTTDGGKTWKKTLFVNNETGGRVVAVNYANPERALCRRCIAASARAGTSSAAGRRPKAASTSPPTAARPGSKLSKRPAVDADRQDRHRHRAQQAVDGLRDGRSARHRGRPLPVDRRRRVVDAREQRREPAHPAVLLPLRRRQSEGRERGLGQRARAPQRSRDGGKHLQRRVHAARATTTASGSTPTTRTSIQSNDGGANVTTDGGRTWSSILNQPTAELYMVAVDEQHPYLLYGRSRTTPR